MTRQSKEPNRYRFGPFTLDGVERVLLRDERLVPLPAKTLSTLLVLVRNSKHVVEKDVLLNEVWPDEFVEEGNLAQHVSALRKALGETQSHKYIETIPRRGYRFLETVNESSTQSRELPAGLNKRHTENSGAYEAYLKGRYYWGKYTTPGLEEAITWFRKSMNLDPGFSLAYAAIIDCYLRLATNYLPPADNPPKTAAILAALEFEDGLHDARAMLELRRKWDTKSADRECQRAWELKTNYPSAHQWYAAYEFARELYERAESHPRPTADIESETVFDTNVLENIQSSRPTPTEELQIFCVVAREQIEAGNYEAACDVLQRWWTLGEWPELDNLSPHSSADLLFTVGTLAGNVVSTRQVPRGQKHAEALLSGSIALFEQVNAKKRAAEGRVELSLCYQREGLFELSRTALLAALGELTDKDMDLRSLALIRMGGLEHKAGHLREAVRRLNEAAKIVESAGPWASGRYLQELASTLKDLANAENRSEYFDQALEHFTAALHEFEAVGHHRLAAILENNFGYLLLDQGRIDEARPHLERSRRLFHGFGDKVRCAQVDETMAQLHLAAGEIELAEQVIVRSIETLDQGGEDPTLAESLRTQGVVLCRMGRYREAQRVLERAQQVAEHCDDTDGAERARVIKLEVIDQLSLELKRSEQRLLAFEMDATERRVVKDLALEMNETLAESKLMLDRILGLNGSGAQTAAGRKPRTSASQEELIATLESLKEAITHELELTRQLMKHSKQETAETSDG